MSDDVLAMEERAAWGLRDRAFGYLFTHHHLLPTFTVAENVAMPFFRICGKREDLAAERTSEVLLFTGIRHLCGTPVGNLDDSTRWLVALARAIVHRPPLLVAISPPSPDLLPLAVAYMIPLVNYGDVVSDEHCLAYGATLFGLMEDDYYRQICAIANSVGANQGCSNDSISLEK